MKLSEEIKLEIARLQKIPIVNQEQEQFILGEITGLTEALRMIVQDHPSEF